MQVILHSAMKLAFHTIGFHSSPIEYAVEEISQLGYRGIELNAESNWALPHVTPQTPSEDRLRIAKFITQHGLQVSSICAHTSLIRPHNGARNEAMRFMRGCIDMAEEFGTQIVHAISGALEGEIEEGDAWGWLLEGVGELVDYSESRGVKFAFEAAANQLVAKSGDMKKLLNSIGSGNLLVNFDPSHPILYGEDPAQLIKVYGKRIIHFHAKDSLGNPKNFQFPPLGMGDIDFGSVLEALKSIRYDGFISVEYEGELFGYEKDPITAARQA